MAKVMVSMNYDSEAIVGISTLEQRQIDSLTFSGQPRLLPEFIYVIPRQWVHDVRLPRRINDIEISRKFFVLCFKGKDLVSILDISASSLKAQYYGLVSEGPLEIMAEQRSGLWRAKQGTPMTSVFSQGYVTIKDDGNRHCYMPKDFAFKVVGRNEVYTSQLFRTAAGYDMKTKIGEDGNTILDLGKLRFNDYEQVMTIPAYNLDNLPEQAKRDILAMQENLPE